MKKILRYIGVIFLIVTFTGCVMEREEIPTNHEAVVEYRDFYYLYPSDNTGGVLPHVLTMGKRNLTNGFNTLYLVNTEIQSISETDFSVLQKEKIQRNYKSLTYSFRVKKGMSLGLLLHFMPKAAIDDAKDNLKKGIYTIDISEKDIFAKNILPIAKMISKDSIDEYTTTGIRIKQVNAEIKKKLIAFLKTIRYSKKVVDVDGKIILKKGETISIIDFIDIVNVSLKLGDLPEAKRVINKRINELNAKKQEIMNDLDIAKNIKREEMATSARHAKTENDNIAKILKGNPKFVQYQRLEDLEDLMDSNMKDNDLEFIYVPADMSSKDVADVMLSTE